MTKISYIYSLKILFQLSPPVLTAEILDQVVRVTVASCVSSLSTLL